MVTPGTASGKPGSQRRNARHVHPGFGFRIRAAQNHVVDLALGHLRMLFEQLIEHRCGHVVRTRVLQRSARRFADGGSQTIDDYGFIHD